MKGRQKPDDRTNRPGEIFRARKGVPPQTARRLLNPHSAVPQIVPMIEARSTPRAERQSFVSPVEVSALSATRAPVVARPPATRSRVGNGSAVLPGIDGRSAQARRYRDLIEALTADLGTSLSEAERLQIRNAASLQLHCEELTARVVRGEPVDGDAITRASNAASRALASLKSKPAKKASGSDPLATYLAQKRAEAAA